MDTINIGDRVSWQSGYTPRVFGIVTGHRKANDLFKTEVYRVRDDSGMPRIVPARFITKECD